MEAPLRAPHLFQSNLKTWVATPPLELVDLRGWEFCETGGYLNLKHLISGEHLHSRSDIEEEVGRWKELIEHERQEWLIVYGVGLGYHYLALSDWLHKDRERHAIFIEDDPGVLRAFLETDVASLFLKDSQVELLFLSPDNLNSQAFHALLQKVLFRRIHITALESYERRKKDDFRQLKLSLDLLRDVYEAKTAEFLLLGKAFFQNFYDNFLRLDQCSDGTRFLNEFEGVPAIICGAGPSLNKNIDELKKLKNRALIFAGGTAMNALNAKDFLPHFGCGVDPFFFHFSRIIANKAFEVPYFVRSRMNKEAFGALHGPKLYLPGATGYPIGKWMDEKVGYSPFQIDEGTNVVNLTLSIAKALGCNPILCVGLDLAYSEGQSYAAGIAPHAIHSKRRQFVTKGPIEELISAKDIYGRPIYTLMKWIWESAWYSSFASTFKEIHLLNCTEGGIGFRGVEEMKLKEAASLYLTEEYDIEGRIEMLLHSGAQKKPPPIYMERAAIQDIADSLNRCSKILFQLEKENPKLFTSTSPERLSPILENFYREDAYQYLLKELDETYLTYLEAISTSKTTPSLHHQTIEGRFPYLKCVVEENMREIKGALERKIQDERALQKEHPSPSVSTESHFTFELKGNQFAMKDPEIGLDVSETLISTPYDPKTRSGLREEMDGKGRHVEYLFEGLLHGPSAFYYPSGELFCRSWYVRGKKMGAFETFDKGGRLLVRKKYKDDLETGLQLYFYPAGGLKSTIPYLSGTLEGIVKLYHPNGVMRREASYRRGKKEGRDRVFASNGELLLEAEYKDDEPIGIARMWHMGGKPALEISYKSPGVIGSTKHWDADGKLISGQEERQDYFDLVAKDTLNLGKSIKKMSIALEKIGGSFGHLGSQGVTNDLKALKMEVEAFEKIGQKLLDTSQSGSESDEEEIWKTPLHQKMIEEFLKINSPAIQESMLKLRRQLKNMLDSIDPFDQKPPENE